MPTYNFTASLCPAPQTRGSAFYAGATPPAPVIGTTPTSANIITVINADQARGNLLARFGGGFYAVWQGLELSVSSGTTIAYSAGQACLDGPAEKLTAGTLALTNNVVNRVWISRAGTVNAVTSASASPLAPPDSASPWCFLGAVTCSAGSIIQIDYSGRFTLMGGMPFRRTADEGEPGDEPSSTLAFYTVTEGGLYLWDGTAYRRLDDTTASLLGTVTTLQGDHEDLLRYFRLQLQWTATVLGTDFIHPDLMTELDFA